jgi:putative ABC transport system permease protein
MQVTFRELLQGLRVGRGTTLLAFVILALAMAAGTVTYSVVDGVALRPLPYGSPERLVGISAPGATAGRLSLLFDRDYVSLLEGTRAFGALGASRFSAPRELEIGGETERLSTRMVTTNLFDVLGVRPAAGRWFGPEHERTQGLGAVILSHQLWVRRFRSDRGVIGRTIRLGQEMFEVVGVLPPGVWYPIEQPPADIYVPYVLAREEGSHALVQAMSVVGRLRPGVSVEQARADVVRVSTSPMVVLGLHEQVVGSARAWLFLALAAVGFVLLVACVNVATLLLVRATSRAQEFAIREGLGAPRWGLAAGRLLEGLFLALGADAAAVIVSVWGVEVVKSNIPPGLLTRVPTIGVDGRVLAVSIAAALVCAVVFASAPAWLAARSDLISVMKASGGPLIGGRRVDRPLAAFLVAEVTAVCILLVAATLVIRSFVLITTADLGFDRRNVFTIGYQRSVKEIPPAARSIAAAALRSELLARARSVPGVTDAAISTNGLVPLAGGGVTYSLVIPGVGDTGLDGMLETRFVTPEYFRVMGMRLLQGRLFDARDRSGAPPVMLVNDVAASRFFPGRNPVGQVVIFRGPTTIVGVLRGVHFNGPEADVRPEMYLPTDQERFREIMETDSGSLVVLASRNPREVAGAVREAIRPTLGGVIPKEAPLIDDYFRRLTSGRRFNARLMASLGFVALLLGFVGVYGTMAFLVARQSREIGLRLALGASPARIMVSVFRKALRPVLLGIAVGLAGAWGASHAFRSFVFGIQPTDPGVYAEVAGALTLACLVATLVPAIRASRVDPLETLRRE